MDLSREQYQQLAARPVAWIEHFLDCQLWAKQQEIARSVIKNRATLVQSANGTGKTHVAGRIAMWWLYTRPSSAVITTASSFRQVERLLWKEIRVALNGATVTLGGEIAPKAPRLELAEDWIAIGFSTDDPVNFQGYHSKGGNLIIVDEAAGVRNPEIWDAIEGSLVGEDDRLLALANPVEPSGYFYERCRKHDGHVIKVSAFDVPNVIEKSNVIPGLVTWDWVEKQRKAWGEASPMYQARILGEFPTNADDCLIPISWVDSAVEKWREIDAKSKWGRPTRMSVDVARLGPDSTVLGIFHEAGLRRLEKLPKQDTMATAGHIVKRARELNIDEVRIDADGVGAGVFDRVYEQLGDRAVSMRGGMVDNRALHDDNGHPTCANNRADWYWQLRNALDPNGETKAPVPPDDRIRAQLSAIKWKVNSRGLIQIETKDEMRKRGVKSPDEADCAMYAQAGLEDAFDVFGHLSAMTRL